MMWTPDPDEAARLRLSMLAAIQAGEIGSFKDEPEPTASIHRLRLLGLRASGFVVGTVGRSLRLTPAGEQFLRLDGDYKALDAWERRDASAPGLSPAATGNQPGPNFSRKTERMR